MNGINSRLTESRGKVRWAVVGSQGLLGAELSAFLAAKGEFVSTLHRANFDLEADVGSLAASISDVDIVVNTVGYTQVDNAETEELEARKVNAVYAEKLAFAAKQVGAKYFYISTDYVFDGSSAEPYLLSAQVNPLTAYGRSKVAGEKAIISVGGECTIFRTSWLYGSTGNCFPRTIYARLLEGKTLKVVDDQVGTPTWTRDLAHVIYEHGLRDYKEPIVHAVSSGRASWYEFALEVLADSGIANGELLPVHSEDYETIARRPKFSVLDNSQTVGPIIGDWKSRWRIAAPEVLTRK